MNDSKYAVLAQHLARGWALVPLQDMSRGVCSCREGNACASAGKHPRFKEWEQPQNLIRTVDALTTMHHAYPLANWGVATGEASGIWALDWDVTHNLGIRQWLTDRIEGDWADGIPDFGTLTLGPTGGGGWHYIFALPPDFIPRGSQTRNRYGLPSGLDVRGVGGQIVVHPSVSGKGPYGGVLLDRPIIRAPRWLEEMLRAPAVQTDRQTAQRNGQASGQANGQTNGQHIVHNAVQHLDTLTRARYERYAERAVTALVEELRAAPGGTRNDTAYRTACRLVELSNAAWAPFDRNAAINAWWSAGRAHPDGIVVPDNELDGVWHRATTHVGGASAVPPADDGWRGVGGTPVPLSEISPVGSSVNGGHPEPASNPVSGPVAVEPGASVQASAPTGLTLPGAFWDARPVLAQIRQYAHHRCVSADVVLYSVLARLAATWPHQVRAPTGIGGPASMNLFVVIAAASGGGKSSGVDAASGLLPRPSWLTDFRDEGVPLGTGEGLAEAYYGSRSRDKPGEDPNPTTGKIKQISVREQVRHNALMYVDEGEALLKVLQRTGATIGETLRRAWIGATIGQQNGRTDTTRIVEKGTYSLGLIIGFQRETVQPLLADAPAGTPQRFLWCWTDDPSLPDGDVPDPGPLHLPGAIVTQSSPIGDSEFTDPAPLRPDLRPITFDPAILGPLRAEHKARVRGEPGARLAELDSHRPLHLVKVAVLLAALDGRRHVNAEDWYLAGVVWSTSCAVRSHLVAYGLEQEGKARAARVAAHAEQEGAAEHARLHVQTGSRAARVAVRLATLLREQEPDAAGQRSISRSAFRRRLNSRDREVFDQAIDHAMRLQWIMEVDDHYTVGSARPA